MPKLSDCTLKVGAAAVQAAYFRGQNLAANRLPLNSIVVSEGDSITAGSNGPQWIFAASILTNGKYYWPYQSNQAVGGQTAAQMATQTAAVVALAPKVVTLLAGTNDLAGTSDTPAVIAANIQTCIDAYIAGGAEYVVLCKVLPRNDATWMAKTPERRADRVTLNALIAAKASAKVKVIDLESTFDPSTDCDDGLHPNWAGAIKLGEAFASALNALIVSGDQTGLYLDSSNMVLSADNPQLTGTAGSKSGALVTGEVATGWTVETNDAGIAVDCSKVADFNGAVGQRLQVSGTSSTNGRVVNFRNSVVYSGSAGQKYEAWVQFELAAGHQNLRALTVSCDTGSSPNSTAAVLMPTARGLSGVLRTIVQTPLAGSDTSNNMQCFATFAAGTVAADITWGKPFLRGPI